jgi:hypothetical protein
MIDLKKIINKPINLSGSKMPDKAPLVNKLRVNNTKRIDLLYKKDIENKEVVVTESQKPERHRRLREVIIKDKSVEIIKEKKSNAIVSNSKQTIIQTEYKHADINIKTAPLHKTKSIVNENNSVVIDNPLIKEPVYVKTLSPETLQAKEDLDSLKNTFSK